ncbi:MAG: exopolyphosphatase [Rhodospirillales bacterium]|nr:exopolyphosphatase [Rhodospirillales bacterium]
MTTARKVRGKAATIEMAGAAGRIGVVDIGSNTVRLVVYEVPARLPFPLFNEKAQCELGRGLGDSGRLNPEGVEAAFRALGRFVPLAHVMGVDRLELVATAAVREASDGAAFAAEIERRFGHRVDVIDGAKEAQLTALGVLSGVPDADGILGDLGGGSLDLVALDGGSFGHTATLPLGHLRLARAPGGRGKTVDLVEAHLATAPWLTDGRGRDLYAGGGAWRSIAKVFLHQLDWPLRVIDNFAVDGAEAGRLLDVLARLGPSSIRRMPFVSRRRLEALPLAALVLEKLIAVVRPARLVFSGFGMREGRMLECLPEDMRLQDPLIAGCLGHAERNGRFSAHGEEILAWMAPLFDDDPPVHARLRLAACLVSDIAWSVHPDYRPENAFHRVLRLPFAGLTHRDRAWLALAIYSRYGGDVGDSLAAPVLPLVDEAARASAVKTGLALLLAHTLSGGAPGLLGATSLRRTPDDLVLDLPKDDAIFQSEAVERRLAQLAKTAGLKARVMTGK